MLSTNDFLKVKTLKCFFGIDQNSTSRFFLYCIYFALPGNSPEKICQIKTHQELLRGDRSVGVRHDHIHFCQRRKWFAQFRGEEECSCAEKLELASADLTYLKPVKNRINGLTYQIETYPSYWQPSWKQFRPFWSPRTPTETELDSYNGKCLFFGLGKGYLLSRISGRLDFSWENKWNRLARCGRAKNE